MGKLNDTTILVCCHKKDYFFDGEGFMPIHVGKALHGDVDLGIPGDDTGENISTKNPNYCELTAHYWLWKNKNYNKYVGLNHYRRYFLFENLPPKHFDSIERTPDQMRLNPPTLPDLDILLSKYDIVLARPRIYPFSLKIDYHRAHIFEDFDILRQAIITCYPDYLKSFDIVMRQNKLSHYNMFITNSDIFNKYSEWLFTILSECERHVKISNYQSQARVFGYMSERLLNVFVFHNHYRVFYAPIVKVVDTPSITGSKWRLKRFIGNLLKIITTKYINRSFDPV